MRGEVADGSSRSMSDPLDSRRDVMGVAGTESATGSETDRPSRRGLAYGDGECEGRDVGRTAETPQLSERRGEERASVAGGTIAGGIALAVVAGDSSGPAPMNNDESSATRSIRVTSSRSRCATNAGGRGRGPGVDSSRTAGAGGSSNETLLRRGSLGAGRGALTLLVARAPRGLGAGAAVSAGLVERNGSGAGLDRLAGTS